MKKKDMKREIVYWWLSKKPFGVDMGEYLANPTHWVGTDDKPLAQMAAEIYWAEQETT